MRLIKIGFFLLILLFLALTGYIYKYQLLVNEGSKLAEERCQTVDTILFKKQREALEYYQLTLTSKDTDLIDKKIAGLKEIYKETIKTSEPWMKKQKYFINRWDFKFFTHKALVDVFYAQYEKYRLDLESNKIMLAAFDSKDVDKSAKLITSIMKKMDDAQKILDEKVKIAENRRDFRYRFIRVPPSNCPTNPLFAPPSYYNPKRPLGKYSLTTIFS